LVLNFGHANSSLEGALLDEAGLGVDVADQAGHHDHMEGGVEEPEEDVHDDEHDGILAELNCGGGEATTSSRECDLESGENPGQRKAEDRHVPADVLDPPAEEAGVSTQVEEPGDEFYHRGEKVDDHGREIRGGRPALLGVTEHGPEPSDGHGFITTHVD